MRHHAATVGLSATLLAVHLPDTLVNYAGKLVFALITAALSTIVSTLIGKWMKRKDNSP